MPALFDLLLVVQNGHTQLQQRLFLHRFQSDGTIVLLSGVFNKTRKAGRNVHIETKLLAFPKGFAFGFDGWVHLLDDMQKFSVHFSALSLMHIHSCFKWICS